MTAEALEALAGPLGGQLQERLSEAIAAAEALVNPAGDPAQGGDSRRGGERERLPVLRSALEAMAGNGSAAVAEQRAALNRVHARFAARFQGLEDARHAIGALRATTSPGEMLTRAPGALCRGSRFARVLLSLTGEGRLVAEAVHLGEEQTREREVLTALRENEIRLEHPLIETELLRRRRATIVDGADLNPRVDRRLVEIMGWVAYAAAPLVVGGQVIGMLHAGRAAGERLDVLDRDVLWEFTSLLAQAYESASLRRTLRYEREQTREFLEWLGARSGELMDAPIRLATMQRPAETPAAAPAVAGGPGRDDRIVFEGLLTRRELDVLRLLAEGGSNRRIAESLVISEGTVKFHVNSILRKLRVSNRAEAVSRYLRLLGMRAP